MGLLLWHRTGALSLTAVTALGVTVFFTGLCRPRALRALHRPFGMLVDGTTYAVTQILLVLSFYLLVTPLAAVMRLLRKHPLQLTLDRGASTYWEKRTREKPVEPSDYERQF